MTSFGLDGRRVLITGGYGGIARHMASRFLQAGCSLILMGRDADKGRALVEELGQDDKVLFAQGDVTSFDDCASAVALAHKHFGGVDVVVAAAGCNRRLPPEDMPIEVWNEVWRSHVDGTFFICRAAFDALKASPHGKIITIGSVMSQRANEVSPAYGAGKGGVVQLTQSFAVSWAKYAIQANCILPGWIDTPSTKQARLDIPGLDDDVKKRTPAGRWGTPSDLAGVALFLASPHSDFVTGAAIPVDGGYLARA